MNEELHHQAMALDDEARLLELDGQHELARERYRKAAELEERCADAAGQGEPRTRGILRVSAVSMWMQARELDRGEALARRYLKEPLLPGYYRELYGLLGEIRRRRAEAADVAIEPPERAAELTAELRRVEADLGAGRVRLWGIRGAA